MITANDSLASEIWQNVKDRPVTLAWAMGYADGYFDCMSATLAQYAVTDPYDRDAVLKAFRKLLRHHGRIES